MPRDPSRIARIIAQLESVWQLFPDQRLVQLVFNICRASDMEYQFYMEDDKFVEAMERYVEEHTEEVT